MTREGVPDGTAVLIVEDDDAIGRQLRLGLTGHGYRPTWCRTGLGGLAHIRQSPCDVLLLDLGLPDIDGVELAREVRAEYPDLLIIMLTARTDEIDIVAGLDAGADDYLLKPFGITVLLARLRAHLRRRAPLPTAGAREIVLGDLTVDLASRRCLVDDVEIALRPKEFDLLAALAAHPNTAISRDDLMTQVWDEHWYGSTKTLDVTIAGLRTHLARCDTNRLSLPTLTTLRGHGYRLDL